MRIAVFGTGGVGGLFGGKLALAGEHEVFFVARGAHLAALRANGLTLRLPDGEVTVPIAAGHATVDPAMIGAVDVVLFCTKTWQLGDAIDQMAPLLGTSTFVVPLLNGVEAAAELVRALGRKRVVGGLCGTLSYVEAPGVVRSVGKANLVRLGELEGGASERAESLRTAFERSGVEAQIPPDIEAALWEKFLFVVPVGGVGAAARAPLGVVRSVPETRALLAGAMREIEALGRARGVALPADAVDKALAFVDRLPHEATSSLQRDLAAGRRSELEAWNGAVVRLGREAAVPTPIHGALYGALLPTELAAQGKLTLPATPGGAR